VTTPRGTCPECGQVSYGWALLQPEHQRCNSCGAKLSIETRRRKDGRAAPKREERQDDETA